MSLRQAVTILESERAQTQRQISEAEATLQALTSRADALSRAIELLTPLIQKPVRSKIPKWQIHPFGAGWKLTTGNRQQRMVSIKPIRAEKIGDRTCYVVSFNQREQFRLWVNMESMQAVDAVGNMVPITDDLLREWADRAAREGSE